MELLGGRLRKIRILALLLTALSFAIIFASVYIRLSMAGLGCADWPDCYGQILAGGPHPHSGGVRILHRVTAALSLLLGFVTLSVCLRPTPIQPAARIATQLLALMILLTFIGLWSAAPHRVWPTFLNILGGLGLVSLSLALYLAVRPDVAPTAPSRPALLPRAGLVALVLASALGALIGARYAAISCATTPACAGVWWPAVGGLAALNPFVTVAAAPLPGDAGGVLLHLLHRYCAVAALLLLGLAGWRALAVDATRTAGRWLLLLLVIEFGLGSLTVVSGFSLWLAIGHSICAAALLAAGIHLVNASKADSRAVTCASACRGHWIR